MTAPDQRRRFYCPVCWRTLGPATTRGHIGDHFDSIGRDTCPMSGQDYALAGRGRPSPTIERDYHRPPPPGPLAPVIVAAVLIDRLGKVLAA